LDPNVLVGLRGKCGELRMTSPPPLQLFIFDAVWSSDLGGKFFKLVFSY
jgi:hypothetical protein